LAASRRVLDKVDPCVLVGHSYAGMIITELGMHPAVKSLVYVMAFQPVFAGDKVGAHSDLLAEFPYLGSPHNA